ncbi:hypothetical protein [Phyllobacterium sp. YR620]|nr:hypothetical protein [Phyllobacterium sp. YR620]
MLFDVLRFGGASVLQLDLVGVDNDLIGLALALDFVDSGFGSGCPASAA